MHPLEHQKSSFHIHSATIVILIRASRDAQPKTPLPTLTRNRAFSTTRLRGSVNPYCFFFSTRSCANARASGRRVGSPEREKKVNMRCIRNARARERDEWADRRIDLFCSGMKRERERKGKRDRKREREKRRKGAAHSSPRVCVGRF